MNGHYMQGCRLDHFKHLLEENRADLAPAQMARIRRCLFYSRLLYPFAEIERCCYAKRIENTPIEKPPLFILGHWRSGTTYLFNLLSCDPETAFMDSMTTFTFNNFLLLRRFLPRVYGKALTGDRPGDSMEFLPHSPQEECYALASYIDETFIHLITFPDNAAHYMDMAFADAMTPAQRKHFCDAHSYLLKKITYYRGGKRILFKSPDNTAKMGLLHDLYPDAKFVHIYRDPYQVLMSTINMFEEGIQSMSFERIPHHEEIRTMAVQFYKRIYTQYLRDMERIPAGALVEVSYDELTRAPAETLQRIYQTLSLPGYEAALPHFRRHIDSQKAYRPNQFRLDNALREEINENLSFFFEHYHIPMRTEKGE